MKKKLHKIPLACALGLLSVGCLFLSSCHAEAQENIQKSKLRGTFTSQSSRDMVQFTNDPNTTDKLYLDTSYCPAHFNGFLNGGAFCEYKSDLRLKLSNDYTYAYNYSITMSDATGSNDFCKMIVSVSGTFEYTDLGNDEYDVLLSRPTGGTEEIYGIQVPGVWGGKGIAHDSPDRIQDFSYADCFTQYDYSFVESRTVRVCKSKREVDGKYISENTVDDALFGFHTGLFNAMACYVSY